MGENGRNKSSEQPKTSIGGDFIIPVLSLAFAAYYFYTVSDMAIGAIFSSVMVGAGLVVLSVILLIRLVARILRGRADLRLGALLYPMGMHKTRFALLGLSVLYVVLMPLLGFTLGTMLFLFMGMLILGVRSRKALAWIPLVMSVGGYALFIVTLETRLPRGPIESILSSVF
jgi:hypothetical protein